MDISMDTPMQIEGNSMDWSPMSPPPELPLSETSIDDLPDELLVKLLSFVPKRRYSGLVNKRFYQAVCDIDNKKNIYKFVLDKSMTSAKIIGIVSSIMESKRLFFEVNFIGINILELSSKSLIIQILQKRSPALRKLVFIDCTMSDTTLLGILCCFNEIEEFSFTESKILRAGPADLIFCMPNLKTIDFTNTECQSDDYKTNTKNDKFFSVFAEMILSSKQLEEVTAGISFLKHFPFDKIKLKHLTMISINPKDLRIGNILSVQTNLESLALPKCYVMDEAFASMKPHIGTLQSLNIQLSGFSQKMISSLATFKLKELTIDGPRTRWLLESLVHFDFKMLTSLNLNLEELLIPDKSFGCFFNVMVNLKSLCIRTNCTSIVDLIFLTGLRRTLKKLTIEYGNLQNLEDSDPSTIRFISRNLQELCILNTDTRFEDKYSFNLGAFPNLRKIDLEGFKVTTKILFDALKGHHNLEYLELRELPSSKSFYEFDNQLAMVLLKYGKNIKVMKIDCSSFTLSDEFMKAQFPIVEHRGCLTILRHR